jgi:hypothetical protein
MKNLIAVLFALGFAFQLQASTVDGYSLPLVSNDPEVNFVLNTIQTRTEYRTDTIAKTCYRTELDGYRNVCQYQPEVVCWEDRNSRRICETRQVYRCHSEPVYRTVPYTCYETVRIPYEVFSNKVRTNVHVKKPSNIPAANDCSLNFTLEGDSLRTVAHCSNLLVSAKKQASERREGDTLIQDVSYDLSFDIMSAVTAPVTPGIQGLSLEGQNLVFTSGDLTKNRNFALKLFVERKKFLKEDETLINRNLAPSEYTFTKINEFQGIVKINLSSLIGEVNSKKKHVFKVNLDVLVDRGAVLNASMPNLSSDASLTVNE